MNARHIALEQVRIEFAQNGKCTREAMRLLVEKRISRKAWNEAATKGLAQFGNKEVIA